MKLKLSSTVIYPETEFGNTAESILYAEGMIYVSYLSNRWPIKKLFVHVLVYYMHVLLFLYILSIVFICV